MPPRRQVAVEDAEFEDLTDGVASGPALATTDTMLVSVELATMLRHQLGLAQEAGLPPLDDFLSQCGVLGSPEDLQWMVAVCCHPGETRAHLNLGRIRQHLQRLKHESDTALAKSMEMAREIKRASSAATLDLEQAADLFYQHCYPDVQECMDIAVEQLQQPRSRIILAALGHYKDELHGVDVTNALEVDGMVAVPTTRSNITAFPGTTSVAFLQRQCPVCQSTFQPDKEKPKQLYCRQTCGNFAYASLQTWAYNASAYEGMASLPRPDPYQHGIPVEQRAQALAWQEAEIPKAIADHERRIREQRARA